MSLQNIQMMILLLDSFIKLAPWRIVTETMDRIGCGASESLARSLLVIAAACAGVCAFPTVSIFGFLLLIGYVGETVSLHMRTNGPLASHVLFGFYLGLIVWGWLCLGGHRLRTSFSGQSAG